MKAPLQTLNVRSEIGLSVDSPRGLVYYMSFARIDIFFDSEKNGNFACRCEKLLHSLMKYHEILAYVELGEYPDDFAALSDKIYPEASPEEKLVIYSNELDHKLLILQDDIPELENSTIAYLRTERYCLHCFYKDLPSDWLCTSSIQDWRDIFANEGRLHVFDYFLNKLNKMRKSVYQPCIERMVCQANQHYQDTLDSLQKKINQLTEVEVIGHPCEATTNKKFDEDSEHAESISKGSSIEADARARFPKRLKSFVNRKFKGIVQAARSL